MKRYERVKVTVEVVVDTSSYVREYGLAGLDDTTVRSDILDHVYNAVSDRMFPHPLDYLWHSVEVKSALSKRQKGEG